MSKRVKGQGDYGSQVDDDLLADIEYCHSLLSQRNLELLILDQTRLDVGLKVVKVIVPGLRHFWKRLGPGRLDNVPVNMGWVKEPIPETQMNPIPLWI